MPQSSFGDASSRRIPPIPARLSAPLSSVSGLTLNPIQATLASGVFVAAEAVAAVAAATPSETSTTLSTNGLQQTRVRSAGNNHAPHVAKTIKKKKRVTLEPKHLEVLLAAYVRGTRDRDTEEHLNIAKGLGTDIGAKQVKTWFKNHAAKERKAAREALNQVIDDDRVQETSEAQPDPSVGEPSSRSGSLYAALFKKKKHESIGLAFFRWEYFDLTVKKRKERDGLDPKNVKDNFLGVKMHEKWSLLSAKKRKDMRLEYKSGELMPSKLAISEVYRKAMALIGDARDYCEAANISFLAMSWDQKKDTAELKLHFSDDLSRHTFEELNGMQGRERRIALEEARKKLGVLRVEERRAALKARLLILLRDAEPQKNHKKVPWKKLQLGTGNVEIVAPTLSEMKLTKIKNMISRPQSWTDRDCTFLEDNFRSIKVDLVKRREAGRNEENDSNPGDGENGSESDKENGSDGGDDCSLGAQGETDNGVGGGRVKFGKSMGCNGISQVDSGGAGVTDNGVGEGWTLSDKKLVLVLGGRRGSLRRDVDEWYDDAMEEESCSESDGVDELEDE
ncbi:hypothetical protein BC829DRAFT_416633 [Chytridium lagenaria]|nr:hypothetical protein BC829DRAFT_416633 [Chytridium lagenaria]